MSAEQTHGALTAASLRTVAGVVLLTALAVAPLDYGSTRLMPFKILISLAAFGGGAWLLSCFFGSSWSLPPLPARVGMVLIGISAVAWWLFLDPPEAPGFTRSHYARVAARWPYSVVPRTPGLLLVWAAAGLLAFLALCDLARDAGWRRGIVIVMTVTGAAVAVLGLLQNATHARGIYWDASHRMPGTFFGTFFHHTAAGAYLNSVWPLAVGLVLYALHLPFRSPRGRALVFGAMGCAGLMFVAHGGHISRLPQVVALVALVLFAAWAGLWRALGQMRGLRVAVVAVAAGLAVGVVALGATRFREIQSRWNLLLPTASAGGPAAAAPAPESDWPRLMRADLFVASDHAKYPFGDRGAMYAAALAAIRAHPWFGWGPGGWTAAEAAHSNDPFIRTFFLTIQFTHEDYLQTCVEWGLIGALGWALLVPGALAHALRRLGTAPSRDFLGAGAVVALGAVLAQSAIDFPLQLPSLQFNAVALSALAWSTPSTSLPPFSV